MGVGRIAVCAAVGALLAGHGLSTLEPARRAALWRAASIMAGREGAPVAQAPLRVAATRPTVPATAATGSGEVIAPDAHGQFRTGIEIDGERLSALVDTGASSVALSYEDADRLGIRPMPSDYRIPVSTANGSALVAEVTLPVVRLGGIVVRGVPALVAGRGQLGQSLLGMSFLSRLSGVRIDHGRLMLAQ